MAVQSSFYTVDGKTKTYPSTKHIATKQNMAVWLQQVSDQAYVQLASEEFELITNAAVLNIAPDPKEYSALEVRVADTPDELGESPSDITTVASISNEVTVVAGIADEVVTVAGDSAVINDVGSDPLRQSIIDAEGNATSAGNSATQAELDMWNTEAYTKTTESYANLFVDTNPANPANYVVVTTSNGDGSFTDTPQPNVYSSKWWTNANEGESAVNKLPKDGTEPMTGNLEAPSISIGGEFISPYDNRNVVTNGDGLVNQRYGNSTLLLTSGNTEYYVDMWQFSATGGSVTLGTNIPSNTNPDIRSEIYIQGNGFNDFCSMFNNIEADNVSHLAGQECVASLRAFSGSATGLDLKFKLHYFNSRNVDSSITIFNATDFHIDAGYNDIEIPVGVIPDECQNGVRITVEVNNLVNDFVKITNVQLEKGTKKSPFEIRKRQAVLADCKSCYQPITQSFTIGKATTIQYEGFTFPVEMRVSPTITNIAIDANPDSSLWVPNSMALISERGYSRVQGTGTPSVGDRITISAIANAGI